MAGRIAKITLMVSGILLIIVIDQLVKYIIRSQGGFYICNSSIAGGIKIPEIIFWILWTMIVGILVYYAYKELVKFSGNSWLLSSISLIIAGALSNIFDRVQSGCVIDYIDFWPLPIFNLADLCITIGGIILVLNLFLRRARKVF